MTRSLSARAAVCLLVLAPACRSTHAPPEPPAIVDALAPPAEMRAPRPLDDDGVFYVLGDDPLRPRVRYLDGQVSLNASCAIRAGNKLGRKIPPVYVNGQPIGFC
jgi:hypothetical protein